MPANVYVDAFNLYYGCLRNTPYRWLDIAALCALEFPGLAINRIRVFTAEVKAHPRDPHQPLRQRAYLDALRTLPNPSIHLGRYSRNKVRMEEAPPPLPPGSPPPPPPPPVPKLVWVWKNEEKGSDVNLATYLLLDAFDQDCTEAIVLSNDSDLEEPIRIVRSRFLPVRLLYPCSGSRSPSYHLRVASAATGSPHLISQANLALAQFPDPVVGPGGPIHKPATW
jgi:hypothetical protein